MKTLMNALKALGVMLLISLLPIIIIGGGILSVLSLPIAVIVIIVLILLTPGIIIGFCAGRKEKKNG